MNSNTKQQLTLVHKDMSLHRAAATLKPLTGEFCYKALFCYESLWVLLWHVPPTAWIMCPATTLKPLRNTLRNTTKSPFATLQTLHIPTWPSIWEIHRKKTWSTVAPSRDPKDRLSTSRCQTPRAQTGQSCFGGREDALYQAGGFNVVADRCVLTDRYLVFEISHLANIWSYETTEGETGVERERNIQEKQEKQTACFGVRVKIYWYLGKIPRWDF